MTSLPDLIFQNLDDLVNSLVKALERRRSSGSCTKTDYENVMKGLRYQLVAMAMAYMCRQSTPRIEIQVLIKDEENENEPMGI